MSELGMAWVWNTVACVGIGQEHSSLGLQRLQSYQLPTGYVRLKDADPRATSGSRMPIHGPRQAQGCRSTGHGKLKESDLLLENTSNNKLA
eukprot:gene15902-22035_t